MSHLIDPAELQAISRAAERLLAGSPLVAPGFRRDRRHLGNGLEFHDYRDFGEGDDPRTIDWRASARARRPQVRRYYDDRSADWIICLDRSASMGIGDLGKWRLAVQLAAAFAYLLIDMDHRVGLVVFSDRVDYLRRPGRGRTAYLQLLRSLVELQPAAPGGASRLACCLGSIRQGCHLLVVSDFLVPGGMREDLRQIQLRADKVRAIQVTDDTDAGVSTTGAARLRDIESGREFDTWVTPELRTAALERLATARTDLAHHCQRRGIAYSHCTPAGDWKSALMAHLGLGRTHAA